MNPPNPPHLELLRRNALLRAWRAVGVPVDGAWSNATLPRQNSSVLAINATCTGKHKNGRACGGTYWAVLLECRGGWRMQRELANCRHLKPLEREPPPDVAAIAELELLAG
jgi:hypothetical protein